MCILGGILCVVGGEKIKEEENDKVYIFKVLYMWKEYFKNVKENWIKYI